MAASDFVVTSYGKSAKEAFRNAQENARFENGNDGYTGTIAEKEGFIRVSKEVCPDYDTAYDLIEQGYRGLDDKWAPCGCVDLGNEKYLFFGVASS